MSSSTPVIVTVWGVDQLAAVNVSIDGERVASPVSDDSTEITTSPVGSVSSTTVNMSVDPPSVTDASSLNVVFDTENPAVSSSATMAVTDWLATSS